MIRFINDFDKDKIVRYLHHELDVLRYYKKSFNYLMKVLPKNSFKKLENCNWYNTKNYDFCFLENKDVAMIIRNYRTHFTLYIKHKRQRKIQGRTINYPKFHIVEFFVDTEKREKEHDNDFLELNKSMKNIIDLVKNDKTHSFWNSSSIPIEPQTTHKIYLTGESFSDIDSSIFAFEELFRLQFEIFCQTTVVEKIQTLKVGDKFGDGTITEVYKENFNYGDEPYYHGIGIKVPEENSYMMDVYHLARWKYDELFGEQKKAIERKYTIKLDDKTYAIANAPVIFCSNVHEIDGKKIFSNTDDITIIKELLKVDFLDTTKVKVTEEVYYKEDEEYEDNEI